MAKTTSPPVDSVPSPMNVVSSWPLHVPWVCQEMDPATLASFTNSSFDILCPYFFYHYLFSQVTCGSNGRMDAGSGYAVGVLYHTFFCCWFGQRKIKGRGCLMGYMTRKTTIGDEMTIRGEIWGGNTTT